MDRVYLDQNKWIDLARAAWKRPGGDKFEDALAVARFGAEQGLVSFPLSSVHYMETLKRKDASSRHRLAALMTDLSRGHRIAPPDKVLPAELDAALNRRFGKPPLPRPLQVFGVGFRFAFGIPPKRYEVPQDISLPPGQKSSFERWANDLIERAMIAGPPEGVPVPGMEENDSYRRFGQSYADGEERLMRAMEEMGVSGDQLPDFIGASEIIDILEVLNEAMDLAGITVAETRILESKEGLTDLILDLPSRFVAHELRGLRHGNRQTKWQPNDLDDLAALSVAVPYCNVVVTEKQWCDLIGRARLTERFGGLVISDVRDLPQVLASKAG